MKLLLPFVFLLLSNSVMAANESQRVLDFFDEIESIGSPLYHSKLLELKLYLESEVDLRYKDELTAEEVERCHLQNNKVGRSMYCPTFSNFNRALIVILREDKWPQKMFSGIIHELRHHINFYQLAKFRLQNVRSLADRTNKMCLMNKGLIPQQLELFVLYSLVSFWNEATAFQIDYELLKLEHTKTVRFGKIDGEDIINLLFERYAKQISELHISREHIQRIYNMSLKSTNFESFYQSSEFSKLLQDVTEYNLKAI